MARCGIIPSAMLKLVRLLIVALLALAVPFQGALAVSTAQCTALEHHPDGSHPHSHDGSDHADHSDADGSAGDSNGSHCGPCTACCASVSIAALPSLSDIVAARYAVNKSHDSPLLGDLPSGLFRPPLAL
jgi:hypothetical protein